MQSCALQLGQREKGGSPKGVASSHCGCRPAGSQSAASLACPVFWLVLPPVARRTPPLSKKCKALSRTLPLQLISFLRAGQLDILPSAAATARRSTGPLTSAHPAHHAEAGGCRDLPPLGQQHRPARAARAYRPLSRAGHARRTADWKTRQGGPQCGGACGDLGSSFRAGLGGADGARSRCRRPARGGQLRAARSRQACGCGHPSRVVLLHEQVCRRAEPLQQPAVDDHGRGRSAPPLASCPVVPPPCPPAFLLTRSQLTLAPAHCGHCPQ